MDHREQIIAPKQSSRLEDNHDELQSIFLQNVQHELRTPVAIILGYAHLLRDQELGMLAPKQQEAIYTIVHQAHQLRTLVERISTLLTVEAQGTYLTPLNMASIITDVIEAQRSEAAEMELTLQVDVPTNLSLVSGDMHHLQQAIDCLLENAIKFTPKGGQITLQIYEEDGWIYLKVVDTGIGIAEDKLADIFNAFYQIDGSSTRKYGGLGLGLTVARAVIRTHGGEIEVISQPGQGSQFVVKLPVWSAEEQSVEGDVNPKHILVVDDEKFIAWMLQEGLEEMPNCEITIASDGKEALQLFETQPFDLLITDYNMPGVSGLELATKVRRLYPQTAIIMLTGYANNILREQAADISIDHILNKPIKLPEIRHLASEALQLENDQPG